MPRRSEILRRPGSDSAVGIDRNHQEAARGKLLCQISVSLVVWCDYVVEFCRRIALALERARSGEGVIAAIIDSRAIWQGYEAATIGHRAEECSTRAVVSVKENNERQSLEFFLLGPPNAGPNFRCAIRHDCRIH